MSDLTLDSMRRRLEQAGVLRAWVFGSAVHGTMRPGSDVDLLIETDREHPLGLLALGRLQMDLTDMAGRPVHLTLLGGVPASARKDLLHHSRALHAA